jgi:hypothetical protein
MGVVLVGKFRLLSPSTLRCILSSRVSKLQRLIKNVSVIRHIDKNQKPKPSATRSKVEEYHLPQNNGEQNTSALGAGTPSPCCQTAF